MAHSCLCRWAPHLELLPAVTAKQPCSPAQGHCSFTALAPRHLRREIWRWHSKRRVLVEAAAGSAAPTVKEESAEKVAVKTSPKGSGQPGARAADWRTAESLLAKGEPFVGKVERVNNGGILVRLNTLLGFIPFSQLDPSRLPRDGSRTAAEVGAGMVGQFIKARVIEANEKESRFVLSERAALWAAAVKPLKLGFVALGTVASIADFGAFIDLQPEEGSSSQVSGLVHLSELSWDPIRHPADVLEVGQQVQVKVVNIDRQRQRIALSIKQLQSDPLLETLDTLMPVEADESTSDVDDNGLSDEELERLPLPGLENICQELEKEEGITKVELGRQALEKRVVSQDLELWLSNLPIEGGYTLLARAGRQVQEVTVTTTLDREGIKAAVQRVTGRVP